jgi:AcrR family transcriptional regulator
MKKRRHVASSKPRNQNPAIETPPARPDLLIGEDFPVLPRQRRSRTKRDALLRAALELFGAKGYEATAIGAIANRSRVAVGSFYQHFRSKRQLLLVLMNELLQKLDQIDMQPAGETLRDRIESVLRAGLATDLAYAGAYRAWREAMLSDRELGARDETIRAWTTARLRFVFRQLQSLPDARTDLDAALFAAMIDRLFWELIGSHSEASEQMVKITAHLIYHSMFRDSRAT